MEGTSDGAQGQAREVGGESRKKYLEAFTKVIK